METGFLRPLRKFGDWMQIGDNPFRVFSEFRLITSVRLLLTSVCPDTSFCIWTKISVMFLDDADLQLFLRHAHDGVGGDLRAGDGGGGDQYDGHALVCLSGVVQQLLDAVRVGNQHTCQLDGVHDAAKLATIRSAPLSLNWSTIF